MLSFQRVGNSAYRDVPGVYVRTRVFPVSAPTANHSKTHIADPNERRRMALAEVDKAPFGWYHVRLVVVTGIGFFTDAYSVSFGSIVATSLTRISSSQSTWQ